VDDHINQVGSSITSGGGAVPVKGPYHAATTTTQLGRRIVANYPGRGIMTIYLAISDMPPPHRASLKRTGTDE